MELRQSAVAAFDSRRGTLKGLGMLRRPRFPPLKHIGGQLPGDRVPVKRVLNGLQRLYKLGFASRATRTRHLVLPIHQRQQLDRVPEQLNVSFHWHILATESKRW